MKIGFDAHDLSPGGTIALVRDLLGRFAETYPRDPVTLFCSPASAELLGEIPPGVECVVLKPKGAVTELEFMTWERKLDVLVRLDPAHLTRTHLSPTRQVVLIHDLHHEFWPDFFGSVRLPKRVDRLKKARGEAVALLAVPEFPRQTILQPPHHRRPVFVPSPSLPQAADSDEPITAAEEAALPRGRYFVYPANI